MEPSLRPRQDETSDPLASSSSPTQLLITNDNDATSRSNDALLPEASESTAFPVTNPANAPYAPHATESQRKNVADSASASNLGSKVTSGCQSGNLPSQETGLVPRQESEPELAPKSGLDLASELGKLEFGQATGSVPKENPSQPSEQGPWRNTLPEVHSTPPVETNPFRRRPEDLTLMRASQAPELPPRISPVFTPESARLEPMQEGSNPFVPEPVSSHSQAFQSLEGASTTYTIKHIRWRDHRSSQNPRKSPILMQSENGPCPLVALVNALVLSIPADHASLSGLVQALSSRENISLDFLVEAVFDELTSEKRSVARLPDVTELHAFLKKLHTGMNVNPRFFPEPPPSDHAPVPGDFESTREMKLYSIFRIPLVHGWLPEESDAAYPVLRHRAETYEDAATLLADEEELERKLQDSAVAGLTTDEQQRYEDILVIKTFLHNNATQLTPFGLDMVARSRAPGEVSILFRNNHFLTLYCHPETLQLLTLVTDSGFATHEEIVWQSLVDIYGEWSEFLSGDFRSIENEVSSQAASRLGGPEEPPTEETRSDLAFALRLQAEEEQRYREDLERQHPNAPSRTGQRVRPLVPPTETQMEARMDPYDPLLPPYEEVPPEPVRRRPGPGPVARPTKTKRKSRDCIVM